MITVFIPGEKGFNYKQARKLYLTCKNKIKDNSSFRDIVENTYFYSFYEEDDFIGCLYFYNKDGKLFVNGFANRHKPTEKCLKMSLDWFNCDIYSQTSHKAAAYTLRRSGFEKIDNDIYIYERSK